MPHAATTPSSGATKYTNTAHVQKAYVYRTAEAPSSGCPARRCKAREPTNAASPTRMQTEAASANLSGYDFHAVSAASRCFMAASPCIPAFESPAFDLRPIPARYWAVSRTENSRWRDLNSQPRLYESRALPLSYIGIQGLYHTLMRPICKE